MGKILLIAVISIILYKIIDNLLEDYYRKHTKDE